MTKYTQKQLREMVAEKIAIDVTKANEETRRQLIEEEGYLSQIGYAAGLYGCNGMLLQGRKTGKLYAVTSRSSAIYLFP